MKVSILIGTRNRFKPLMNCLESIFKQDYNEYEILVLDDHSTDIRIEKLITEKYSDVRLRLFRSSQVLGVAGGRNFLMKQARGDIFCIIDDDAIMDHPGCLRSLVDYLEEQSKVGILAFKVIDYGKNKIQLLVPFSKYWRRLIPELTESKQVVSYYLGGFHAIRKEVIEDCGYYYSGLVFGEEEMDLAYRAIEAGYEIHYLPEIIAHHYPEASVIDIGNRKHGTELLHHVRNRFYLAYKYLPVMYIPIYLFFWLTVYGCFALKKWILMDYARGALEGIKHCRSLHRTPLSRGTLTYLKRNYGRIWY